jgi:hypothetical protein
VWRAKAAQSGLVRPFPSSAQSLGDRTEYAQFIKTVIVRLVGAVFLSIQVSGGLQATLASDSTTGVVTLDAKPEPIAIESARTAVIVVDMENDFAAKGGMFDRAGIDISGAQLNRLFLNALTRARAKSLVSPIGRLRKWLPKA